MGGELAIVTQARRERSVHDLPRRKAQIGGDRSRLPFKFLAAHEW
jgi:hypothetical protein